MRFDQQEVEPLLIRSRGEVCDIAWINLLTPVNAKEELVQRFYNLGRNLVRVLITGKYNPRSSFQQSFLKYFCKDKTPLTNIANALKQELSIYDPMELETAMDLAIREAVRDSTSNMATTILIKFHDLIEAMIKNSNKNKECSYEESKEVQNKADHSPYNDLVTNIALLQSLTEAELAIVKKIQMGRSVKIPDRLRTKLFELLKTQ